MHKYIYIYIYILRFFLSILVSGSVYTSSGVLYNLKYFCRIDLTEPVFSFYQYFLFLLPFLSSSKTSSSPLYCFFVMSVCLFNSLTNDEYWNVLVVAAFSNKSFSGKTSLSVKNSYLPTILDSEAEILAVCLPKLYWALHYFILFSIVLIFKLTIIL